MIREGHVRFWERVGAKLPRATRQVKGHLGGMQSCREAVGKLYIIGEAHPPVRLQQAVLPGGLGLSNQNSARIGPSRDRNSIT